jgi:NAD(P)-dependent dehydrogenase (short-subunit alcohol dehydrogenase family)
MTLRDKRILLTGASGHLGRATAIAISEAGGSLILSGRNLGRLEDVGRRLTTPVEYLVMDASDPEACRKAIKAQLDGPLHGLVNNAYSGTGGTVQTAQPDDFRDSYEIGMVTPQVIIQTCLPHLKLAKRKASIVNIGSMYGHVSPDTRLYETDAGTNPPFYGAMKAALTQYTRYAACELGPLGIRVNSVSPGPFPSDQVQTQNPAFIEALADRVPLGRIGHASEVGGPVVFLLSDAASYINGADIRVDGGWTQW